MELASNRKQKCADYKTAGQYEISGDGSPKRITRQSAF
jgi:hypothetical protein